MKPEDEEKIAFIAHRDLYHYQVMAFDLKNVGVIYQHLVNILFIDQLKKRSCKRSLNHFQNLTGQSHEIEP